MLPAGAGHLSAVQGLTRSHGSPEVAQPIIGKQGRTVAGMRHQDVLQENVISPKSISRIVKAAMLGF